MKLDYVIPSLVLAGLPLFCLAAPVSKQDATATILHIEDQWLHAKTAQDASQFMAPDFIGVSTRGALETREQRLARFHAGARPPATAVHFEHLTVAFPATGVAIATGKVVGTAANGAATYTVSFSDTFCLRQDRWLAVHAQETVALSSQ